jgi:hypothetical protein
MYMKKLFFWTLAAVLVLGISAFGQEKLMKADIPFDFTVENKHMPAGNYELRVSNDLHSVILVDPKTKQEAEIGVMTRLADVPNRSGTSLTFDQVGNTYVLETYWPVADDGFLLHTTRGKHQHKVVQIT